MDWVRSVVDSISSGVGALLKSYNVEVIEAKASIDRDLTVVADGRRIRAGAVVVATGTEPVDIPALKVDGEIVHNNRTILGLRNPPSRVVVVGGGYVGLEYANILLRLGAEVTIVEVMDRLLPGMDPDLSRVIERALRRRGARVLKKTTVKEYVRVGEGVARVRLSGGVELEADTILVSVGRRPCTTGLGLERLNVRLDDRGYVVVDESMRTSNPRILASGDVTGPPLLAHKAFAQAVVAAETARGLKARYDYRAVPSVVFTEPEIVSVGYTLEEARSRGYDAVEFKYPVGGLARARIEGASEGLVKIVYDRRSGTILGIHMAAPGASEVAGEASLIIETGLTLEDLALTMHPHPTISEALREAAEAALGRPIHYVTKRR
jgi:dihydrolipoamide dehydrogenase